MHTDISHAIHGNIYSWPDSWQQHTLLQNRSNPGTVTWHQPPSHRRQDYSEVCTHTYRKSLSGHQSRTRPGRSRWFTSLHDKTSAAFSPPLVTGRPATAILSRDHRSARKQGPMSRQSSMTFARRCQTGKLLRTSSNVLRATSHKIVFVKFQRMNGTRLRVFVEHA